MNDTCQGCGLDFDEWSINELGLCQDCELNRIGSPLGSEYERPDEE